MAKFICGDDGITRVYLSQFSYGIELNAGPHLIGYFDNETNSFHIEKQNLASMGIELVIQES